MLLTFKKADVLKKLRDAKAREEETIEKNNASIDADFERDRKAAIEKCERHIKALQTAKQSLNSHEWMPTLKRRSPDKVEVLKYDTAIFLLENCAEDEVKIDTDRDKLGLGAAIKAALQ